MQLNKIINTAYSFGAAVVVFGAWAKLEHQWYSSIALTTGLFTETAIFCIYGLLEWRKEPADGDKIAEADKGAAGSADGYDRVEGRAALKELTSAVQKTNYLIGKVFRTGE